VGRGHGYLAHLVIVDKDVHIWLLHFLFLGYINSDADAWM